MVSVDGEYNCKPKLEHDVTVTPFGGSVHSGPTLAFDSSHT